MNSFQGCTVPARTTTVFVHQQIDAATEVRMDCRVEISRVGQLFGQSAAIVGLLGK